MGITAQRKRGFHGGKWKDRGKPKSEMLRSHGVSEGGEMSQHNVLSLDGSRVMAQGTSYLAEDPAPISYDLQLPVTPTPEDPTSFSDLQKPHQIRTVWLHKLTTEKVALNFTVINICVVTLTFHNEPNLVCC